MKNKSNLSEVKSKLKMEYFVIYCLIVLFLYYFNDHKRFISFDALSIIAHSIGSQYSCYINQNYKMKCFGYNDKKQLGLGDSADNKGDNKNEMGPNLAFVDPGTIDNAKFKSVYCGLFILVLF